MIMIIIIIIIIILTMNFNSECKIVVSIRLTYVVHYCISLWCFLKANTFRKVIYCSLVQTSTPATLYLVYCVHL